MSIPTADNLRLLNLAYQKMQQDFRVFAPGLFRDNETIAITSGSYLLLPTYVTELEDIRWSSNVHRELKVIPYELRHTHTGYFQHGVDSSTGKRRLKCVDGGQDLVTGTNFIVHYLREYNDLASEGSTPIPFSGQVYRDMLTTLQAYYYYVELGKEKTKDAAQKLKEYEILLSAARRDFLDDSAEYGLSSHPDSGMPTSQPVLYPSNA